MTKDQAIEAMKQGKKVTHTLFLPDEFLTMRRDFLVDENGYLLCYDTFWDIRTDESWNDNWRLFEENPAPE